MSWAYAGFGTPSCPIQVTCTGRSWPVMLKSDAPLRKMTHELATVMNIEPLFMDPYQSAWTGTVLLQHLCCHPDQFFWITGLWLNADGMRLLPRKISEWSKILYSDVSLITMTTYIGVQLIGPIPCHCERDIEYFLFSFAGERWKSNLSTSAHFVIFQGGIVESNLICLEHTLKSPWNWWAKLRSLRRSGRMFGMCPVLWEIWRCQYFCLRHFVTVLIVMIWHWNLVMVDWHVFVMR